MVDNAFWENFLFLGSAYPLRLKSAHRGEAELRTTCDSRTNDYDWLK